jgi:hypothetical protein
VIRPYFVSYPNSWLIHRKLLMVDARPASTFRDIVHPWSIVELLAESSRCVVEPGSSPQSIRERRALPIPDSMLLDWFIQGSEATKSNFLFLRSSFASHLAVASAFQILFGAHPCPSVLFFDDRQRVCIPGSIGENNHIVHLPLSDQIQKLLPRFVLKGSFSTSWGTVMNSIGKNATKLTILLTVLVPQDNAKKLPPKAMVNRVTKLSVQITESTGKCDELFPFALLDHLIDASNNAFHAQTMRFGWV